MSTSPHHLILGGQRSGKSRFAERLALQWLSQGEGRRVSVVATALPGDDEMRLRIARHQQDRPSQFGTIECPYDLGGALQQASSPEHMLIVDCLTLWATNWLMPAQGRADDATWQAAREGLLGALPQLASPVVLVSNEIGWGVVPLAAEVRRFVDELGWLNQAVAPCCSQVTLMVAGQAWSQAVNKVAAP